MKKLLSIVLTIVMLSTFVFSTVTTVSAADVNVGIDSLEDVISFLDNNMPDSALKRIEVYNILSTYAKTDMGLDTLIGVIDGTIDADTLPDIKKIVDELAANGASLADAKDELIFMINLIKGLQDKDVVNAVADFEKIRAEAETKSGKEKEIIESQDELKRMYELLVSPEGIEKLSVHNVGPNAILSLLSAFKGDVMLTDDQVGGEDFALSWVGDSYDGSVFDYIDSVNGYDVDGVEDIFNEILVTVNETYSADVKADIKKVFGEIFIYEPLKGEDDEDDGIYDPIKRPDSSSGGTTGGIVFPKATPAPEVEEPVYEEVEEGLKIEAPQEAEAVMPDTAEHWAKNYVAATVNKGLFIGYDNGNFEPEWGITRQEMAIVLVRLLGLEDQLGKAPGVTYKDYTEIAPWAYEYVALTTKLGIYEGYDDGFFRPKKIVTREELCAILIRAMEDSGNKLLLNYTDRDSFPDWSTPYIGKASYFGIVNGYPDGEFKPRQDVTRAEAAKILYNYTQLAK